MKLFVEVCRYPKNGEFLDSAVDVTAVGVDILADLVGIPAAEWVGVVPLAEEHAERVRELTGITLGLEAYDYFLEPSSG
ncbi:DUF7683 domain-containing protein [Streptomyces griseorubiginosus]|uniref:DUF7683 domain-containing protein n=1 Tax=Streptomyces griseorubiginosus TaxID=67304 RepID=UPI002E81346E|nr:hypothetical protein [Streptomyces griseorubiginosus]WUB46195.1 hypothetical protein OHN19_23820 [Streptomyces griseorubiginosus]WUB54716.1 hypothetical protein OG942_23820 [Streptomyces griseorubiginosus]